MNRFIKTLVATTLIMVMSVTTCFAADTTSITSTDQSATTTVQVDTTKTISEGGSLPDDLSWTVTVPTSITLYPSEGTTSLTANTAFGNSDARVIIEGLISSDYFRFSAMSTNGADDGTSITLVNNLDPYYVTTGGNFSLSYGEAVNTIIVLDADEGDVTEIKSKLFQGAYDIPVIISSVKNVTAYGVYEGGLQFSVSVTK